MKADYWNDIHKYCEQRSVSFMEEHLDISKIPSIIEMAQKTLKEKGHEENGREISGPQVTGYIRGYCEGRMSTMFEYMLYLFPDDPGQRKEKLEAYFSRKEMGYVTGLFHRYVISELSFIGEQELLDRSRLYLKTFRETLKEIDKEDLYRVYLERHPTDYSAFSDHETISSVKAQHEKRFWDAVQYILSAAVDEPVPSDSSYIVFSGIQREADTEAPYYFMMPVQDLLKGLVDGKIYYATSADRKAAGGYFIADSPVTQKYICEILADLLFDISEEGEPVILTEIDQKELDNLTETDCAEDEETDPCKASFLSDIRQYEFWKTQRVRSYEDYTREKEVVQLLLKMLPSALEQ